MLQDFLMVEYYFGPIESAQNFEDMVRKYGGLKVKVALDQGFLQAFQVHLGPDQGKILCSLTAKGRLQAQQ